MERCSAGGSTIPRHRLVDKRARDAKTTGFGHRLPRGNGESAALNCAAHSANYSISCGHPMAEPGTIKFHFTIYYISIFSRSDIGKGLTQQEAVFESHEKPKDTESNSTFIGRNRDERQ